MSFLPDWLPPLLMGVGAAYIAFNAVRVRARTKEQRSRLDEITRNLTRMSMDLVLPGAAPAPEKKPTDEESLDTPALPRKQREWTGVNPGPDYDLPPKKPRAPKVVKHEATGAAQQHQFMPIAVTLLILLSALWVILSNSTYDEGTKRWAFGAVGLVAGYWLNTKKH